MKLLIKSSDLFDLNYSEFFDTEKQALGNETEYSYKDGKNICKVIISPLENYIKIFRAGEINSEQLFKTDEVTDFSYLTDNFEKFFFIKTNNLVILPKKISLNYDIIEGDMVINNINLEITEL